MQKLVKLVKNVTEEIDGLAIEVVEEELRPREVAGRLRQVRRYYLEKLSEVGKKSSGSVASFEVLVVERFLNELESLADTVQEERTPADVIQEYLAYWMNGLNQQFCRALERRK